MGDFPSKSFMVLESNYVMPNLPDFPFFWLVYTEPLIAIYIYMVPLKGNTVLTHNRLAYLVCKSIKQCAVVCINLSSSLLYAWKLMHGVLNHFMRGTYSTYGLWSMVYGTYVWSMVLCNVCTAWVTCTLHQWVNCE